MEVIMRIIDRIPWKDFGRFFLVLATSRKWAMFVSIVLLVLAATAVQIYWVRSTQYEGLVRSTLNNDSMATPQRFKGLEAFIMSSYRLDSSLVDELREMDLSSDYVSLLTLLQERMIEFAALIRKDADCETRRNPSAECTETRRKMRQFMSPESLRVPEGSNNGMILSDDDPAGFLFLPVNLLRTTLKNNVRRQLKFNIERTRVCEQELRPLMRDEKELLKDVGLTKYLAETLKAFTTKNIFAQIQGENKVSNNLSATPAQVYMITKNGVNRIFNATNIPKFYASQFPANTFFPSRPYFWPAFEGETMSTSLDAIAPSKTQKKLGSYFYVSQPYLDLGGNGIVITLVHGLEIDNFPQAAICFDLTFRGIERGTNDNNGMDKALVSQIDTFGGTRVPVKCTFPNQGRPSCTADLKQGETPTSAQNDLLNKMAVFLENYGVGQKRSEVFGNIQVISREEPIKVSVPIKADPPREDVQTGEFLLFSLNLADYRWNTQMIALAAATLFGSLTMLLVYLWGSTIRHKREYEGALHRVAEVMYKSPTPYVRLNAEDRICDVNTSLCARLGYTEKELKERTFQSLCDDNSASEYEKVQDKRRKGEAVTPYQLKLVRRDGSLLAIEVVSAGVPSEKPGTLPETFGILLDK